jgi:hypothetical protein
MCGVVVGVCWCDRRVGESETYADACVLIADISGFTKLNEA